MISSPHLTVRGFKSIASLENFELRPLNVLIGANGAGKSNFLDLLRMLTAVMHRTLQLYVAQQGGPDAMLHRGRKHTESIEVEYALGDAAYRLSLAPVGEHLDSLSGAEVYGQVAFQAARGWPSQRRLISRSKASTALARRAALAAGASKTADMAVRMTRAWVRW